MFKKIFMFSPVSFKICDRNLHQLPCYTVIMPEGGIRQHRRRARRLRADAASEVEQMLHEQNHGRGNRLRRGDANVGRHMATA